MPRVVSGVAVVFGKEEAAAQQDAAGVEGMQQGEEEISGEAEIFEDCIYLNPKRYRYNLVGVLDSSSWRQASTTFYLKITTESTEEGACLAARSTRVLSVRDAPICVHRRQSAVLALVAVLPRWAKGCPVVSAALSFVLMVKPFFTA